MEPSRIGIHESTSIDFPYDVLVEELSNVDADFRSIREDTTDAAVEECDAFVTFTHQPRLLEADPMWVHTTQAGVDGFPLDEYAARDVTLTNSTGLHGDSVGETTVALVLALARRIHRFVENQGARRWEFPAWNEAFTITGKSACVVGLGTVGAGAAKRLDALGMDVVGVRRTPEPEPYLDRVHTPDELHEALRDAKFVVLAVPLTEETESMIGPTELEVMRDDAYLVNVARGPVADEEALISALNAETIAGAALDVFGTEPLPEGSPFWTMDEVIVTPHAAVANESFYVDVAAVVRENHRRLGEGREVRNRVI